MGHEISKIVDKVEHVPTLEGTEAITNYTEAANLQNMDEKVKSMMGASENYIKSGRKEKAKVCKMCGKEGASTTIMNHIEANHIDGTSYSCNICEYVAKTRNSIAKHKSLYHRQHLDETNKSMMEVSENYVQGGKNVAITYDTAASDLQHLDDKIKTMMEVSE